mmetsp:Transcript_34652/g.79820  ORF Transcript_34652/g.79820 Transcript_34652/m.79820 type:complete len:697 (-) Transcript_34652:133-2223(-)
MEMRLPKLALLLLLGVLFFLGQGHGDSAAHGRLLKATKAEAAEASTEGEEVSVAKSEGEAEGEAVAEEGEAEGEALGEAAGGEEKGEAAGEVVGHAEGEAEVEGGEAEELGEEGGEEGEEGEEEGEEFDGKDFQVAYMLLGAVIFVVSLFYLVNWNDDDIRYYSMNIISMTMSIFSAVLMFQGINEQIRRFSTQLTHEHRVAIQFAHALIYIVAMQFVIGGISGVFPSLRSSDMTGKFGDKKWIVADGLRCDYMRALDVDEEKYVRNKTATKSVWIDQYGVEVPVSFEFYEKQTAQRRMRCWAMLLAHMSGFAAINAGGQLQEMEVFRASPWMEIIPAIVVTSLLQATFMLATYFRAKTMDMSDPMKVDLCKEAVLEAENDVNALSLSFLVVQAIRFAVGGIMPNAEGLEEPPVVHSWKEIIILLAIATAMCFAAIALSLNLAGGKEGEEEAEETLVTRVGHVIANSLAMCFAWIILFGARWVVLKMEFIHLDVETMIGQVTLALVLSILCGLAVFALDFVDDHTRGSGSAEDGAKAIRVIIQAIAILIGFSWERCFDEGVLAVAMSAPDRRLAKFFMGLVVFLFLVPAWRRHILTKVLAYEEMKKRRAHMSKKRHSKRMESHHKYAPVFEGSATPRELELVADVEQPKSAAETFLSAKKGEKVLIRPLDGTQDWFWATMKDKSGLVPKSAVKNLS